MPTKTNNIGGHGGKRPGSGPKKGVKAGSKPVLVPFVREDGAKPVGVKMPKPHEFMSARQKDGQPFQAPEIYETTWEWLASVGCAALVNRDLVERYAASTARWIQCEEAISEYGLLAEHPTTGNPIPSPYVNMGVQYMNLSARQWAEIYQIVKEAGAASAMADVEAFQDDPMEGLLKAKGL